MAASPSPGRVRYLRESPRATESVDGGPGRLTPCGPDPSGRSHVTPARWQSLRPSHHCTDRIRPSGRPHPTKFADNAAAHAPRNSGRRDCARAHQEQRPIDTRTQRHRLPGLADPDRWGRRKEHALQLRLALRVTRSRFTRGRVSLRADLLSAWLHTGGGRRVGAHGLRSRLSPTWRLLLSKATRDRRGAYPEAFQWFPFKPTARTPRSPLRQPRRTSPRREGSPGTA